MEDPVRNKTTAFFAQYKPQAYKKGEILIRADDDPSGIFYIEDGLVKEYAISRKGEELVVNIFKEGAFFPMTWGINKTTNRFFFEAVNLTQIRKAPREKVVEFIKREPDVMYDLLSRVYKGLDGVLMRMVYLMSGSAYSRLVTELLIGAKRFGVIDEKTKSVICKVTEKDLASQTGMTRETVSREMKRLKDKGILDFHTNALVIKDMHKLETELADDFSGLF